MLLYKNMLLEEDGQKQAALDHLEARQGEIVDALLLLEKRAQLLRELGRYTDAEPIYRQLLRRNGGEPRSQRPQLVRPCCVGTDPVTHLREGRALPIGSSPDVDSDMEWNQYFEIQKLQHLKRLIQSL